MMEAKLLSELFKIVTGRIGDIRPNYIPFFKTQLADISRQAILIKGPGVTIQTNGINHSTRSLKRLASHCGERLSSGEEFTTTLPTRHLEIETAIIRAPL